MKLVMTSLLEKSTQPGQPLGDKPPFMTLPSLHKPNQVNNTSHSGFTTPGSGATRKAPSDVPCRYNENPHTGVINRRLDEINSFNPEVLSFTQAEALLYAAGHANPNASQSQAIWANAGCGAGVDYLNYPGAFYRSSTMYRAECGEAGYSTALRSMHKPIDLLATSTTLPKLRSGEQRTSCSMESSFVHTQSSPNERSNSETEANSFHHTLMHPYFSWDELRHQHAVSYPRNPYEQNISSVNFASRFPTQMYPSHPVVNLPHPTPAEVPTMASPTNSNQHLGPDIQQQVSPSISFVPGDVPAQGFSQNIDAPLSYFQPPSFNQLIRELQYTNQSSDFEGIQASNPWRGIRLHNRFPESDDTNLRKLSDVCATASEPDSRLPNVSENKKTAPPDFSAAAVSSEAESPGHVGRKGFPRSCRYPSKGDILSGRASESWEKLNFAAAKCAEMSSSSSKPREESFCGSEAEIDVVGCESGKVPLAAMVKTLTMPKRIKKRSTAVQQSECNVCGKKLSRASTLKIHMRQHTGDRPFKCAVCAKTFAQAGLLQSHSRIHTGERPFTCSYCRKKFAHSGALKTHVRTHTGEKPHKCPAVGCYLAFGDSSTLSKHTRTHTGERPYACDICGKRFTQSGNMHKHKKYVHKVPRNCQAGKATRSLGSVARTAEKGKLVER